MTNSPPESKAHNRRTALIMLTLVCIFWGSTFPLMKESNPLIEGVIGDNGEDLAPMAFLALRFVLATLLMPLAFLPALLARKKSKNQPSVEVSEPKRSLKPLWMLSAALGIVFTGSFYLQVYGLRDTTPAISAFLTSLYVIFTPMIVLMVGRKLPGWRVLVSTAIALTGVGFIAYEPGLTFDALIGDWGVMLSLACALGFGVHIVLTDYATRREDPALLSFLMMVVSSIAALAVLVVALTPARSLEVLWGMLIDWEIMWRMAIMVIFATTFAVFAWNRWQKDLGPTRASVLYTLEPVFATAISLTRDGDLLRWQLIIGGGLILAANLYCELAAALREKRNRKRAKEAQAEAFV